MRTGLLAILVALIATSSAHAAPQVTITAGPPPATNASTATLAFAVTEGGTTTCQLDAGAFAACTSPVTYAALADGEHTFRVRTGDFQAASTWTVDTVPPDTVFTAAPASPSRETHPIFALESEPGVRFQCSLNGVPFASCEAKGKSAGPLKEGQNSFAARAVDAAGNADPTPAQHAWIADFTRPARPIFSLSPIPENRGTGGPRIVPNLFGGVRIVLDRESVLSWSVKELGGLVSFSLERRRENRKREESRDVVAVYDDSGSGALVKRIKPGETRTTIGRGRSLCIAGVTADAAGHRSEYAAFACATRPFAIRSSDRFKLKNTKVSRDPTAWSGKSVRLKPKGRVDMLTGTFTTPREATLITSVGLVGRACPSCGKVVMTIETLEQSCEGGGFRALSCYFVAGPTLARTVSFRGKRKQIDIRSVTLPARNLTTKRRLLVRRLRFRARGGQVRLAGIAIPNLGGTWDPPPGY